MKIIGNTKDYYDFLVGQYGIDPKVVYERVCMTLVGDKWTKAGMYKPAYLNPPVADSSPYYEKPSSVYFYVLAICGKYYCVFIHSELPLV